MKAFSIRITKAYKVMKVEVAIDTKSGGSRLVRFEADYDCIPNVVARLQEAWSQERTSRLGEIHRIDKYLPITQ